MKRNITAETKILINNETFEQEICDMLVEYNHLSARDLSKLSADDVIADLIGAYEQSEPDVILIDEAAEAAAETYPYDEYPWGLCTVGDLAERVYDRLSEDVECAAWALANQDIDYAYAGWVLDEEAEIDYCSGRPYPKNWLSAHAHNERTGETGIIYWVMTNPDADDGSALVEDWSCCCDIVIDCDSVYWLVDDCTTSGAFWVSEPMPAAKNDDDAIAIGRSRWEQLGRYDQSRRDAFYVAIGNSDELGSLSDHDVLIDFTKEAAEDDA